MPMPILQGKLRGKKIIVGSSQHGCWLGSYEYHERLLFESLIKEGSVVFDLGAHVGYYSLLSSVLVGQTGKVFAFEPLPRNLFYLNKHIQINKINNVTVIDAAVSDSSGWTFFDEIPGNVGSFKGQISPKGKLKVRTVGLDDLIKRRETPIPNFVKIDIEGNELLALSGAKSLLANAHPTLFLSTHGPIIHKECCHFLKSLGYRLSSIDNKDIEKTKEILAVY
jgi:FkbM family methyltransferase